MTTQEKINRYISLRSACKECTKCNLSSTRTQVVCGSTRTDQRVNVNAKIFFIGEAPGHYEDINGTPFVGKSGQLLRSFIEAYSLENVSYITNTVKCRPPNNATPEFNQIESCTPWLLQEIEVINPEIIVYVGKTAEKVKPIIDKQNSNIKSISIYHPSYLLRTGLTAIEKAKDHKFGKIYHESFQKIVDIIFP